MPRVNGWRSVFFMKKKLLLFLQIGVSLGLLIWLFQRDDLRGQVSQVLREAEPTWLLAGFLVAGIGNFLGIWRWGIFVNMLHLRVPPWDVVRIGLVGLLFNSFLIGAVGGDAVKVLWLVARKEKKSAALLSVAMDRMSGVIALVMVSLVFMLWRLDWLQQSTTVTRLVHFIFGYLAILVFLLVFSFGIAWKKVIDWLPTRTPGYARIREFSATYRLFISQWPRTLLGIALSVLGFFTYFLTFYCAARAFQVQIPLPNFFAIMPTIDLIASLPVSIGGFGVREHLFTVLLGELASVPAAQAVLISLGGTLLTMVWGLGGLIAFPSYKRLEPTKETPVIP